MFKNDEEMGIYFANQLEVVKAKSYDVEYPELIARTILPISYDAGPYAETISYEQYDRVGSAKIISNYANDLPRVDIKGKKFSANVRTIGAAFGYNVDEITKSAFTGKNLEQRRVNTARRAAMETENRIALFGDASHGLVGFLSNTNVPTGAVPADGTGNLTTFASKSPDQILRDVGELISAVKTTTKNVEAANTVLFSVSTMAYLKDTPRGAHSDTSILKWLMDNNPMITSWIEVYDLETAGPSGENMMVAYNKNPDKLQLEVPMEFTTLPPQPKGLEFEVPCHQKTGGVNIYYPFSINKRYGV